MSTQPLSAGLRALAGVFFQTIVWTLKRTLDVAVGLVMIGYLLMYAAGLGGLDGSSALWLVVGPSLETFVYYAFTILFIWVLFGASVVEPEEWFETDGQATETVLGRTVSGLYSSIYTATVVGVAATLAVHGGTVSVETLALPLAATVPIGETTALRRWSTSPLSLVAFVFLVAWSPFILVGSIPWIVIRQTSNVASDAWRLVAGAISEAAESRPGDSSLVDLAGSLFRSRSRPG
jgi:hypothetical protein